MPYVLEPTLRERLWVWLEAQNFEVAGEVPLENGRIDVLGKSPRGEYIGYEVKDQEKLNRDKAGGLQPKEVRDLFKQLNKYSDSGYLDRLYVCSQEPSPIGERINRSDLVIDIDSMNDAMGGGNISTENLHIKNPNKIGIIKIPLDFTGQEEPEIKQKASQLYRSKEPLLPTDNEAWVQHHVWRRHHVALREGVIPNISENTEKRIDVIGFEEETDPTKIYQHQSEYSIIGIEAKGSSLDSEVQSQLEKYLNSGALTELWLAVPEQDRRTALELLSEQSNISSFIDKKDDDRTKSPTVSKIGLQTVDSEGEVAVVREAETIEMRYDGMRARDTGDYCKSVGWGALDYRECDEFECVFDQEDPIHRKARKIDVCFSKQNRRLIEAKYKVQSGGKPTEEERELIEEAYASQYGNDD